MRNEPKLETRDFGTNYRRDLRATGGNIIQGDPGGVFRGISTDSRSISKGTCFSRSGEEI
jgi:hypothetical protein